MNGLTGAELEVLTGAALDETAAQTAKRLGKSIETVKTQRSSVIHKLHARSMMGAVSNAYKLGILGTPTETWERVTAGQLAALNKKSSLIDRLRDLDDRATKKLLFRQASLEFGRQIESLNDLSRREASMLLDLLERILDGADTQIGVGERELLTAAGASA